MKALEPQLRPIAVIASTAFRAGARVGLDIGDLMLYDDYTRNFTSLLRDELFRRAGLSPSDIEFAEIAWSFFKSRLTMPVAGSTDARETTP